MQNKKKKNKELHFQKKGFSIGEVLIASFLLLVGIVTATALIVGNMREAFDARDTIIAAQLSQEGIELVRNVRDTNTAKYNYCLDAGCSLPDPFKRMLDDQSKSTYYIEPDYSRDDNAFLLKRGSADKFILSVNNTGKYSYHAPSPDWEVTRFHRRIIIDYDTNSSLDDYDDDTAVIYSLVSWKGEAPSGDVNKLDECTTKNKCAFAKDVLTGWLTTE